MWWVEVQLTRYLLEVNFKLLPLYFQGMKPRYPLKVGQVGPRTGVNILEKIITPRQGIDLQYHGWTRKILYGNSYSVQTLLIVHKNYLIRIFFRLGKTANLYFLKSWFP
jgi:hypothetical protein